MYFSVGFVVVRTDPWVVAEASVIVDVIELVVAVTAVVIELVIVAVIVVVNIIKLVGHPCISEGKQPRPSRDSSLQIMVTLRPR